MIKKYIYICICNTTYRKYLNNQTIASESIETMVFFDTSNYAMNYCCYSIYKYIWNENIIDNVILCKVVHCCCVCFYFPSMIMIIHAWISKTRVFNLVIEKIKHETFLYPCSLVATLQQRIWTHRCNFARVVNLQHSKLTPYKQ